MNIKISQVCWCSRWYMEFTLTFSLYYLFDCKFVDLIIFFFFQGKFAVLEVLRAWARPIGTERAICPGLLHNALKMDTYIHNWPMFDFS